MNRTSIADTVAKKKAVIFDLFHTLAAVGSSWASGLPSTWDMLGVDRDAWSEQLLLHSRSRLAGQEKDAVSIVSRMARAIDPTIPDETIRAASANRSRRFEAALLDVPRETMAVLQALRARGKRLGLVSNADTVEVAAWDRSPLAGIFDATILSCSVATVKPEREIYEICLARLELEPSDALYVGDGGSSELQGAQAVGLTTVMTTGLVKNLRAREIEERKAHGDERQ